jgi:hypothetical protein
MPFSPTDVTQMQITGKCGLSHLGAFYIYSNSPLFFDELSLSLRFQNSVFVKKMQIERFIVSIAEKLTCFMLR